MKGQIFRIAHLGYFDFAGSVRDDRGAGDDPARPTAVPVTFGTGVAAVQKVYAEAALRESKTANTPNHLMNILIAEPMAAAGRRSCCSRSRVGQ